jgi:hypothetical protein
MIQNPSATPSRAKSYGNAGDKFLADLYASVGATSVEQKINVLLMNLDGEFNFYAMGGEVTSEIKLACLEHEILEREGKIELTLA